MFRLKLCWDIFCGFSEYFQIVQNRVLCFEIFFELFKCGIFGVKQNPSCCFEHILKGIVDFPFRHTPRFLEYPA